MTKHKTETILQEKVYLSTSDQVNELKPCAAELFVSIFIHTQLKLLMQFPSLNE